MTIALYIFSQRNRLPGPPRNPHFHFSQMLPLCVHSLAVRDSHRRRLTPASLPPGQKKKRKKKGARSVTASGASHDFETKLSAKRSFLLLYLLQWAGPLKGQQLQFDATWFHKKLNFLHGKRDFSPSAKADLKAGVRRYECVMIIKVERRGRISLSLILTCGWHSWVRFRMVELNKTKQAQWLFSPKHLNLVASPLHRDGPTEPFSGPFL